MLSPKLPAGFHAQAAFHHQDGFTSFDFYRVYTAEREQDFARCYWLLTHAEDTRGPNPPTSRWVAFADWQHANHKGELDYSEFSNPQTPMATVRKWVDAATIRDLVKLPEH